MVKVTVLDTVLSTVEGFDCVKREPLQGCLRDTEDTRDIFIFNPKKYVYLKDKKGTKERYLLLRYTSVLEIRPVQTYKSALGCIISTKRFEDRFLYNDVAKSRDLREKVGNFLSTGLRYSSLWYPAVVFDGNYIRLVEVLL